MSNKNIDNDLKEKPFTSYGELQRKKEMKKIMLDNQRLLERIQHAVPSYDHVEWERDADKRVEYLRNMTEFPDYFHAPGMQPRASTAGKIHKQLDNANHNNDIGGRDDLFAPQPPPIFGTTENIPRTLGHRPMLPNITSHSPRI